METRRNSSHLVASSLATFLRHLSVPVSLRLFVFFLSRGSITLEHNRCDHSDALLSFLFDQRMFWFASIAPIHVGLGKKEKKYKQAFVLVCGR